MPPGWQSSSSGYTRQPQEEAKASVNNVGWPRNMVQSCWTMSPTSTRTRIKRRSFLHQPTRWFLLLLSTMPKFTVENLHTVCSGTSRSKAHKGGHKPCSWSPVYHGHGQHAHLWTWHAHTRILWSLQFRNLWSHIWKLQATCSFQTSISGMSYFHWPN